MLPGLNVAFCMTGGEDTRVVQAAEISVETLVRTAVVFHLRSCFSHVPGCGQAQYQAPWLLEIVRRFCLQEVMDGCYVGQAVGRREHF